MATDLKKSGTIVAVAIVSALAAGGAAKALDAKKKTAQPVAIHFLGEAPHRYQIDAYVKSDGRLVSRSLLCSANGDQAHVMGTEPSDLVKDDTLLAACKQMTAAGAAIAAALQDGVGALDVQADVKVEVSAPPK